MAVAAGRSALCAGDQLCSKIVLVTEEPDFLQGSPAPAVLHAALALDTGTEVEQRVGGGVAAVDALSAARAGTLVIAVSSSEPAGAAAIILSTEDELRSIGRAYRSLPTRIHPVSGEMVNYADPRLTRERGNLAGARALLGNAVPLAVTGVGSDRKRLGVDTAVTPEAAAGAAEPLFALAEFYESGQSGQLLAVEDASAAMLEVAPSGKVLRIDREAQDADGLPKLVPGDVPLSLPAYDRAFTAKVGFLGGRCTCGELSYPPRTVCLTCGRSEAPTLVPLPRTGEVYTKTTIRTSVPGLACPYSLAIVALDGVEVRVLGHVTDAPAGNVEIGERCELVLRRIALRHSVVDYGYAVRLIGGRQ
jgi:uncharacterized OB-fold protein